MSTIEFKGTSFTAFIAHILSENTEQLIRDLSVWVGKAPELFNATPIIIQPSPLCAFSVTSLSLVIHKLRQTGCIPVGLITSDAEMILIARECGLSVVNKDLHRAKAPKLQPQSATQNAAQVMNHTIRSGQQIYAKNRDLIVVGSVNHGAEVIADGHIHVYGSLLGKALAGAGGGEDVSIFAQRFKPQMVAIAGYYKILEELPAAVIQQSVQASLVNNQLSFSTI